LLLDAGLCAALLAAAAAASLPSDLFFLVSSFSFVSQLNAYYEARRDDLWYGYKYPIQPQELKDDDEAVRVGDESHHAYKWNAKHPGHEFGIEKKKHH